MINTFITGMFRIGCLILLMFLWSCSENKTSPNESFSGAVGEWPRNIPARIADDDNRDLFVMTLGDISTPLADGIYNPVKDEVTMNNGDLLPNYYRDSLGIRFYKPMDKTIFPLPLSGLCTWYYYYQDINEAEVKKNTDWIADNLMEYGAKYVQIDDGWQKEKADGRHGSRDWTGVDTAFSSGMASLAEYIKSKGLVPGIWIAPHGQSNFDVVKENPGVFLFKPDSSSASRSWEGDYLVDPSAPETQQYLKDLFSMMVDWGYDYFKIDGQPVVVNEYRKTKEYMKVPGDVDSLYRNTLISIRDAIGPERYLLGCWGIPVEGVGIMDGSRTGGDVVLGWSGFDVSLMPTMRYYFMHNIVWYTDPDVMLLRQPLTIEQARVWATLQGLTGQALMGSDRLPDLSEERVKIMKKVFPAVDIRPLDLFPNETRKRIWDLKINHLGRQYDVVGLFNFGEDSNSQLNLNWADLGLDEDMPYHVFDFWNDEYMGAWEKGMAIEVAPTSCRVLTLLPESDKIALISTNRHITQGWIDLIEIKEDENKISGKSHIIKDDPYELHFVYPRGEYYKISDVSVKGTGSKKDVKITNHQGWGTVTIESPLSGVINWEVCFEADDNYKYLTRDPGRLSIKAAGLDAAKITWGAQYYLNTGYQVYLDDELMGYSPATYYTFTGLDPARQYKADVRTVWDDGEVNARPSGEDKEYGLSFSVRSLLPSEMRLSELTPVNNVFDYGLQASLNGKSYPDNIITMANNKADYKVYGLFKTFTASIGVDDNSSIGEGQEQGLVFKVYGDGKVIYTSPALRKGDKALDIKVNISGVQTLTVATEGLQESGWGRRGMMGDWANPILIK